MAPLDLTKVQSHLRLTLYGLAHLQERHDQTSNITKRDVATLISQDEISTARNKVEKLIQDDRLSALVERLESCCNVVLERFSELSQPINFDSESLLVDALCTLLLLGPQTGTKDLIVLCDFLIQLPGMERNKAVIENYGSHIPSQFFHILDRRLPSAAQVDVYMASVAQEYNLSWIPPLLPHQKAHALSETLDPNTLSRTVDIQGLQQISLRGIPPQPPWLRPRVWKLLFGILSPQKDSWEIEAHSKRRSYYDLARSLLSRLETLPPPTTPLSALDISLLNLDKSLSTLPPELDVDVELSPLCPLDIVAPEGLRIENANAVDERLRSIQVHVYGASRLPGTPEIRLEQADLQLPEISVTSEESLTDNVGDRPSGTVLHSSALTRSHATSLLRIMYMHLAMHPSGSVVDLTSLLVPLYVVMVQEIEPVELAHVEADTFWLLAELWGEVSELFESEGSQMWMAKLGQRLAWADPELHEDLGRKGLDPALPHYSYRWLALLLTRTLSFPSIFTIWDALFACPSRRSTSDDAKLEFLVDICSSMLINARLRLFRLGRTKTDSNGLWADVEVAFPPSSTNFLEIEEAFSQGMSLLQRYPMEELGGAERVIDIAIGLSTRRRNENNKGSMGFGIGERLKGSVLSGFITRASPAEPSIPEATDESDGSPSPDWPDSGDEGRGDATELSGGALFTKLGNTVWRGITNQSSMDAPLSPLPPSSPLLPPSPGSISGPSSPNPPNTATAAAARFGNRLGTSIWRGLTNQSAMEAPPSPNESQMPSPAQSDYEDHTSPRSSIFWSYTERFKDSDAAASLSKTSTNLTAKASSFWRRSNPSSTVSSPGYTSFHSRTGSLGMSAKHWVDAHPKRGSLPTHYDREYSPPPRPHFRESRFFSPIERPGSESPIRSTTGLPSPPALFAKGKSALASITGVSPAASTSKSGPRPLLLSSSSLITPSHSRRSSRAPTPVRTRDSVSSTSSASTSQSITRNTTLSDRDSESNNGRYVPLRRAVTPRPSGRPVSKDETFQRPNQGIGSESLHEVFDSRLFMEHRESSEVSSKRGWGPVESPSSSSSQIPIPNVSDIVLNRERMPAQSSTPPNLSHDTVHSIPIERRGRKKSWNVSPAPGSPLEATSDSSTSQDHISSVRSKRYAQRPTNLRLKKSETELGRANMTIADQKTIVDSNGLVPENLSDVTSLTPRATDFPSPNSPSRPTRARRNSRSPRGALRKEAPSVKESGGEEGDDEGYDDFLSAYESEGSAQAAMTSKLV